MHIRSPSEQFLVDVFSDPWWDLMLLANLVILILCLVMRPRWRAMDEAGHIAVEKKRQALKQTQKS